MGDVEREEGGFAFQNGKDVHRVWTNFLVSEPEGDLVRLFEARIDAQELAKERRGTLSIFHEIDKSSDTLIHVRESPGHT